MLPTGVRTLVEFSSDPLNGKLFKEKESRTEINGKQKSADKMDSVSAVWARFFSLSAINERIPADPYGQSPRK